MPRSESMRGVAVRSALPTSVMLVLLVGAIAWSGEHRLKTEHFLIEYPDGALEKALQVGRDLESALPTLAGSMDVTLREPVRVRLFWTRLEMYDAIGGEPRPYVMGLADGSRNQILLGLFGTESLRQTAEHELAHIVLHHRFGDMHPADQPRWLHEGFAQLATQELTVAQRQVLGEAAVSNTLLDIDQMEQAFSGKAAEVALAYAQAHTLVAYLHELRPQGGLAELAKNLEQTGNLDRAFIRTYGMSRQEIEDQWLRAARSEHLAAGIPMSVELTIFAAMALLFIVTMVSVNRRRAAIRERLREQEIARALAHSPFGTTRRARADRSRRQGEER